MGFELAVFLGITEVGLCEGFGLPAVFPAGGLEFKTGNVPGSCGIGSSMALDDRPPKNEGAFFKTSQMEMA